MLTPWQKIIRAAKRGSGLRLTAEECWSLRMDDAIETKATNDDIEQGLLGEAAKIDFQSGKHERNAKG